MSYVDGAWIERDSGETFPVVDPATGEAIADVPGSARKRHGARSSGRALVPGLARKLLAKERARVLRRWYELMLEHQDDLSLS